MKTHLSSMAALLLVALFVVPASAEFDYYASVSADEAADSLSASADEDVPAELDYIEATYRETSWLGDAAQQDDGCKGGCDCCPGIAPNMIGDSIGVPIVLAGSGFAQGTGRHFAKVAENNNALPQTRIATTSNYYFDVPTVWTDPAGNVIEETDIHEHKLYLERAFGCGNWSVNLTLPVYHTTEFQQASFPATTEGWEFGNLSFGFKRVLMRGCNGAVSGGLLVEAPTARDHVISGTVIRNDEWFLTPYLAAQYTPNESLFAQVFASYRFRTGTNEAVGTGLEFIQSERLMLDAGVGYWLWRNDCCRFITGLAPTVELHYTTFTEDQFPPTLFSHIYFNRVDMFNLTAGVTAELANGASVALAAALPLRDGTFPGGNLDTDAPMDWELIMQLNKRF
jgi:hypothetical protein